MLLLSKKFRDASLSVETRVTLLHMAMIIDSLPRICFITMLPVGLHLANAAGLTQLDAMTMTGFWLLAAVLLTINMTAAKNMGTPLGTQLQRLNWLGLGVTGLALIGTGAFSMLNGHPVAPSWLAAKLVVYGLVYWFAVGIDWLFLPMGRLVKELQEKGSSEALERDITATVDGAMWPVVIVYAGVLAAAFIGMAKFSF